MSNVAAYLAAAVLLGYAVYRALVDRRSAGYPPRTAVYGFVVSEGATMALLAPASSDLLSGIGVSALSVVLAGEIVRTAAVGFLMLIGYSLAPPPARTPAFVIPVAVLVQVLMTAAFLDARTVMTPDGSLVVHGFGRPLLALHDALFGAYAIWCLIVVLVALAHEAYRAAPGQLRNGLRLTLAAACVGIVWSAWTADDVINVLRTGYQDGAEDIPSNVLGAVCATLVVAGTTVAKWGDAAGAPLRWLRAYRRYRRLTPLWEALHTELPQIALTEPRRGIAGALPPNAEFALYRRVIEIHDGRLALRPYAPPRSAIVAALASAASIDSLYEAMAIASALENLRAGRRLAAPSDEESAPADDPSADEVSGSVDAEAAWLLEVAAAFDSPAVHAALSHPDLR